MPCVRQTFYGRHTAQHQKEKHTPYFEVSAIQPSSVALTRSGDEKQRKKYCNFLILIGYSIQRLISVKKWSKELKNDDLEQKSKPIRIFDCSEYIL